MAKESLADSEETDQTKSTSVKRIDVLPDEVLLDIFDFFTNSYPRHGVKKGIEAWQSLVHVCRRWRTLVFESPRRLNLRLSCTPNTPAKDTLDVWPPLPLLVQGFMVDPDTDNPSSGTDNIIAALGQSNRVYEVNLNLWDLADQQLVLATMQVPFPELTDLQLELFSFDETPIIPDSFLGGSAPRLQRFSLSGILFPGLSNLLLSATRLVRLDLDNLPHSGYISPKGIVALLSTLSSLRRFSLGFQHYESLDRESQSLPSPERSVLPALGKLYFKGVAEYLEQIVARIDTPRLYYMEITFLNDIDFDTPRLAQFIDRTPTLRTLDKGQIQSRPFRAFPVTLRHRTSESRFDKLVISISYNDPYWPLSFVKACNSSLHPLSTVQDLHIDHAYSNLALPDDAIEIAPWLELLLPFTAVKNLYLFKVFVPGIMDSLQGLVGARITEVLPSLQNIFVEGLEPSGPVQENIAQFVAVRQVSDHPIAISVWYKDPRAIIK